MKTILRIVVAVAALLLAASPQGAALRPEKATDASVCDLGPNTTPVLSRRMLIPGDASNKDQAEAYFRLAARFVLDSCKPGQMLVVHGQSSDPVDLASLTQLTNSACAVSEVQRAETPFVYAGRTRPGFELRCPISKFDTLGQQLSDSERVESTDALKARMLARAPSTSAASSPSAKRDCSKMSLATLTQGGSPDCK